MTKKNKKLVLMILLILGVVGVLGLMGSLDKYFVAGDLAQSFTPVFCNDYSFTCCNEKLDYSQNFKLTTTDAIICPSYAYKCTVTSAQSEFYVGSQDCGYKWGWRYGGGYYYHCDDDAKYSAPKDVSPLDYVMGGATLGNNIVMKVYTLRLDFCGRAGCTVGVPVLGADQCKFNPENGKIYTTAQQLINAVSYTVPEGQCVLSFQRGDRFICGYKEETCNGDSDCGGHTYGNYECSGRTLQKYGCVSFGESQPLERDRFPSEAGWGSSQETTFGRRCEIISAEQVQCCGDSACGSNAFCDIGNTWTCKQQVQCYQDVDCGVTQQCDYVSKKLKTPRCRNGQCTYDEVSVECCNDQNCPAAGYFCNANRKCEERLVSCIPCPYECCQDECDLNGGYFDKDCPLENPFCVDNACIDEDIPPTTCNNCDDYALSELIGWLFPSKSCEPKLIHKLGLCLFSFVKLLAIPVVFIFTSVFMNNIFRTSKKFKIKNKGAGLLLAVSLGILASLITFNLFWVGIIIMVGVIALKFVL